jgi:membrane fusion protein (multidrug efflux system)
MNPVENKISSVPQTPLADAAGTAPAAAGESSAPKLGLWTLVIIFLLVIALIAGFIPRWLHRNSLAKETRELATPTVQVLHAIPGKATSALTLPAEVKAFVEAPIYARASGFLKKWYADIGARVKEGQLLADIDTPELEQQLTGARAELAQAEAGAALARITADRWAALLKTSSVSQQEDAEKQGDLKLKLAAVDTATANVHRLEDLQSFTHVTAPFAGTLTARVIDVGDLISSGKELFRLADISKLRVFVRVPQTATLGIAVGVPADLTVPEMPARKFPAKVVRTSGAIDTGSRTLLTELEVENPNNEILSGSYAEVNFVDLKQDPALVLPANTLIFRGEGTQVGVVGADNKVELKNITIGRDFGKSIEVLNGITASDQVIVNPPDSLTSGAVVRIAETPAPETAQ